MGDKPNPPAYPACADGFGNYLHSQPGMTLRDYFAGQALGGMLASEGPESTSSGYYESRWAAQRAYEIADAMLKERARAQAGEGASA